MHTCAGLFVGVIVSGVVIGLLLVLLTVAVVLLCTNARARRKMKEMLMPNDTLRHLSESGKYVYHRRLCMQ